MQGKFFPENEDVKIGGMEGEGEEVDEFKYLRLKISAEDWMEEELNQRLPDGRKTWER